jgi:hypothetical protein
VRRLAVMRFLQVRRLARLDLDHAARAPALTSSARWPAFRRSNGCASRSTSARG